MRLTTINRTIIPRITAMKCGVLCGALLVFLPLGCSSGGSTSTDPKGESTHIAQAGMHVSKYITENKGQVPKNTGDMKEWAAKNNIPEDQLVSTRDHEPYQVHQVDKGPEKELILTETTGAKGKKFMWQQPGHTPLGFEADQAQIDSAIKGSSGERAGRPG